MSSQTRYVELGYRLDSPRNWRIVDKDSGSSVGPSYGSKGELLADLDRYAANFGCTDAIARANTVEAELRRDLAGTSAALDAERQKVAAMLSWMERMAPSWDDEARAIIARVKGAQQP